MRFRQHRFGVTLIELMVVISIIVILLGVAVPLIKPALGDRKLREASRQVAVFLELAKSRAAETGRAHGVLFYRDTASEDTTDTSAAATNLTGVHCYQMSLASVPPPFTGDANAVVSFDAGSASIAHFNTDASTTAGARNSLLPAFIERDFIQIGDSIRINYRGPLYRITAISPQPTGTPKRYSTPPLDIHLAIAVPPGSSASLPPIAGASSAYPYQIIRQPTSSVGSPQELPTGIVLDTLHSGFSSGSLQTLGPLSGGSRLGSLAPWPGSASDRFMIMFGPDGRVETVYSVFATGNAPPLATRTFRAVVPLSPIHLLIGKQNQTMFNAVNGSDVAVNNLNDPANLWVTLNHRTGRISTSENATLPKNAAGLPLGGIADQRTSARVFARSAATSGGN